MRWCRECTCIQRLHIPISSRSQDRHLSHASHRSGGQLKSSERKLEERGSRRPPADKSTGRPTMIGRYGCLVHGEAIKYCSTGRVSWRNATCSCPSCRLLTLPLLSPTLPKRARRCECHHSIERVTYGRRLPDLAIKPWVPAAPHKAFCLVNATVIDSANGWFLNGPHNVMVENGTITSVQPTASSTVDTSVEQFDVTGKFVCPGLIDAHVHITAVPGVEVGSSLRL